MRYSHAKHFLRTLTTCRAGLHLCAPSRHRALKARLAASHTFASSRHTLHHGARGGRQEERAVASQAFKAPFIIFNQLSMSLHVFTGSKNLATCEPSGLRRLPNSHMGRRPSASPRCQRPRSPWTCNKSCELWSRTVLHRPSPCGKQCRNKPAL